MTGFPRESESTRTSTAVAVNGRKRLRRLIILTLLISIGIHFLAGMGAGIWVIARYFTQPKTQFVVAKKLLPPTDRQHRLAIEEVTSLRPNFRVENRIQGLRPSHLALPALPKMPLETLMPVDPGALIANEVEGMGKYGDGAGDGSGFFGGGGVAGSGVLEGTFYDLKRTADGQPTDFDGPVRLGDPARDVPYDRLVRRFVSAWNPAVLGDCFVAPKKLYATQLSIPVMQATEGLKAFGVTGSPGYWLVHYKGRVVAPKDGTFRFVGVGDNVLIVRFNRETVLDGSWDPILNHARNPSRIYTYPKMQKLDPWSYGKRIPGHVIGRNVTLKKGQICDLEVLIGEKNGGKFNCSLLIEEAGSTYATDEAGNPILPFFKQRSSSLEGTAADKLPPFSTDALIWEPASLNRAQPGGGL